MKPMIFKSKSIVLIFTVLFITGLFSCDDYFEVERVSSFEPENIFVNVDLTRQAILGIYQLMTRDEGYSKRISMYYGVDTDIAMCTGSLDNGRRGIAKYAANSGNEEIYKPWTNFYNGIERANICIEEIPKSPLYNNGSDDEQYEMKRMHGEALTLRALHYYELVRNWGDVPLQLKPYKPGDDLNPPKTDRDIIYEQIISDLLLAETLVPWRSMVPNDERITKGAVKGLLARIALARGGYSLRREGGMQRGTNHLEYYQIARDQCWEIMQSGEHALNPDYEDIFRTQCELKLENAYYESMWEVAMGQSVSGENGYYLGTKLGDKSRYGKGNPGLQAIPTYFYSFDSLDTRRDVTIAYYEVDDDNIRLLRDLNNINVAKWRRDWMDPLFPGTAKYTGINWVLLRYSDILLMFAEAENELNSGPTQAAIDALKAVRERAFRGNEDQIPSIPSDYEGFFHAIVQERAWEFGGECLRKHDLIRWNMLDSKLSEMKDELRKLAVREYPYEDIPENIVWRNNGEQLEFLNMYYYMDSAAIADRDTVYWPNVTEWTASISDEYINTIAEFFQPNSRELLPIHQNIIDVNANLENDYGY
ncbi:MAG: RagB/SusD family nutrient uptake outer membrane protein [Bacteroidales bacterium]|nr:RagB/SusD family nutrient uptake outer membrane protein [Bacteroidales bacterium]